MDKINPDTTHFAIPLLFSYVKLEHITVIKLFDFSVYIEIGVQRQLFGYNYIWEK